MNDLAVYACADGDAVRMRPLVDDNVDPRIRGAFARDRDRILYSRAFRRLANKTQVYFSASGNEHMHTRLTHTLEVAHIAKSIARSLRLNMDLVEAITFGHDIGHSPFGHAGEAALNEFLSGGFFVPSVLQSRFADCADLVTQVREGGSTLLSPSGFQHSFQSVRVLTFLENYDPTPGDKQSGIYEDGLNLTLQTLSGILHHTRIKIAPGATGNTYPDTAFGLYKILIGKSDCASTVEGQVVAVADEIAQIVHDLHDAIEKGAYSIRAFAELPEVLSILKAVGKEKRWKVSRDFFMALHDHVEAGHVLDMHLRYEDDRRIDQRQEHAIITAQLCSVIMGYLVRSTIAGFREGLERHCDSGVRGAIVPNLEPPIPEFAGLKRVKNAIVINNFEVNRMDNKGRFIIRRLLKAYLSDPRQLPDSCLGRYMLMKHRQLAGARGVFDSWIQQVSLFLEPSSRLAPGGLDALFNLVTEETGGQAFRRAPRQLLVNLFPYMLLDGDYLRTVVDHIASMTDRYAEQEVAKLYF